ncbi:UPF0449 protein C19orf25 homolog isoform X2 [Heptranchias perlo]|uniref:UPF0449 protein C19orf25 homolog isoform X2 n=1 Tax=Heptranchias perlo TaxID=212740 RepID=UPI00355AAC09
MTSKNKKRVTLPTRPEPPTIEQILEDVRRARLSDPVFASLAEEFLAPVRAELLMPDVEIQYQQSRAYVELNRGLEEKLCELASQCEDLKKAGERLDLSISEIKDKTFQNEANYKE